MINLQTFCSEVNPILTDPFVDNGFEYATNGKILVAVKTDKPNSEKKHPQKNNELFERVWDEGWEPVKINLPDKTEHNCHFCNGTGREHRLCDICGGSGRHQCECGTEHECGYCDKGYIEDGDGEKCPECEGDGKAFENQKYGLLYFPGFEIARIVKHLLNPMATEMATESTILRFEFDGGKGLLMGSIENSYTKK